MVKDTVDGALYNDHGYSKLAKFLADSIFDAKNNKENIRDGIHKLVMEKNFYWLNDFKVPNGVHVYGRRYNPFGPQNYPYEIEKTREYTSIRDKAIWATLAGKKFDISTLTQGPQTPYVPTNYITPDKNSRTETSNTPGPQGTKIQVPRLQIEPRMRTLSWPFNPVQLAFDNRGRLFIKVPTTESAILPTDKLIILEDTNNDGGWQQTNFADDLHRLVLNSRRSLCFSKWQSCLSSGYRWRRQIRNAVCFGFDDHDTHHAISSFCADPRSHYVRRVFLQPCRNCLVHKEGPMVDSTGMILEPVD